MTDSTILLKIFILDLISLWCSCSSSCYVFVNINSIYNNRQQMLLVSDINITISIPNSKTISNLCIISNWIHQYYNIYVQTDFILWMSAYRIAYPWSLSILENEKGATYLKLDDYTNQCWWRFLVYEDQLISSKALLEKTSMIDINLHCQSFFTLSTFRCQLNTWPDQVDAEEEEAVADHGRLLIIIYNFVEAVH